MPQNTRIEYKNGELVDGHQGVLKGDERGLISYTADYREYTIGAAQLTNDSGSAELNVDAAIGGTPDNVYIDEPTTNWTNSALSGTWDFASAAITPQGGTECIDATSTVNGSAAQMERSSSISMASYSAVSGYIYLTSWDNARHSLDLEIRLAGVGQGNSVNIADYIDVGLLNSWQRFIIPKGDLGLNGTILDQLVFTVNVTNGQPPNFYLDTINIEQSGSEIFSYQPQPGQVFELLSVHFTFRDAITVIEPNQIMGVSALANGLRIRTKVSDRTTFSARYKTFNDFMAFGGDITTQIIGATESLVRISAEGPGGTPARLVGDDEDQYSVVVSDDLTGLDSFRVLIRGRFLRR